MDYGQDDGDVNFWLCRRKEFFNTLLGWEDIKDLKSSTVTKTYMDDTLPDGPVERTVEYVAPFDKCDREKDCETVWKFFEELKN